MNPMGNLAADARSLDALKSQAARDPQQAVRSAAAQFEALFMRQLLKSMRDAMPKSGMWDSPGQAMYVDMFDQQMAQSMAGRSGGLAEVIARQLSAHVRGGVKPGDVAPAFGQPGAIAPGESSRSSAALDGSAAAGAKAATDAGGLAVGPHDQVRAARYAAAMAAARVAALAAESGNPAAPAAGAGSFPFAAAGPLRLQAFDLAPLDGASEPGPEAPGATRADFVRRMWPQALQAQRVTGVAAEFIVGQAALESGWGRSEIRNADGSPSHNLFGIKAGANWNGAIADATTTEYVAGKASRRVERFRSYGSYAEAFKDWAALVANSPRYGQVVRTGADAEGFAHGMQRAGYATDPNYGNKLERVINQTLAIRRLAI